MGDAEVESALPGETPPKDGDDAGAPAVRAEEQSGHVEDGVAETTAKADGNGVPTGDDGDSDRGGEDGNNRTPMTNGIEEEDRLGEAGAGGEGEGVPKGSGGVEDADGVDDDAMYGRVRGFALAAINAVRHWTAFEWTAVGNYNCCRSSRREPQLCSTLPWLFFCTMCAVDGCCFGVGVCVGMKMAKGRPYIFFYNLNFSLWHQS